MMIILLNLFFLLLHERKYESLFVFEVGERQDGNLTELHLSVNSIELLLF